MFIAFIALGDVFVIDAYTMIISDCIVSGNAWEISLKLALRTIHTRLFDLVIVLIRGVLKNI